MDSHSLLQGIFPTQRLNSGFLHCRQILYHLSLQIAKVHIKGMISGSQDSNFRIYRKVLNSLTWDLTFFNNHLFDVQVTCPLLQKFYITWLLPLPPGNSFHRVILDVISRVLSPKNSHWITPNFQTLGFEYFFKSTYITPQTVFELLPWTGKVVRDKQLLPSLAKNWDK